MTPGGVGGLTDHDTWTQNHVCWFLPDSWLPRSVSGSNLVPFENLCGVNVIQGKIAMHQHSVQHFDRQLCLALSKLAHPLEALKAPSSPFNLLHKIYILWLFKKFHDCWWQFENLSYFKTYGTKHQEASYLRNEGLVRKQPPDEAALDARHLLDGHLDAELQRRHGKLIRWPRAQPKTEVLKTWR